MALSAIIANPLRVSGYGLPPQVVILCRVLALALLVTNHQSQIQTPFLPFLDVFDALPPQAFQFALRAALIIGALGILFTGRIRTFAALAGFALLLGVLSSRAYYGNNKTFVGLLLILSALSSATGPPRLLQWQLALVYFGAGLNKALDPDWQSGQFFENWAGVRLQNDAYLWLSAHLPPLLAGKLLSWYTFTAELALAAMIFFPRLHPAVIWGSGLFQAGLLLFTGDPFNLFFYGMQASLYAFARWPHPAIIVIWDGKCGFCRRSKEFVQKFDFDGVFDWRPLQSGIGERYGLTQEQLKKALYAVGPNWVLSGYSAFRRMVLHLPLFALVLTAAVALGPGPTARRAIVGGALLFLLPLSNPVGNFVYRWIARHRNELGKSATCEIPDHRA